MSVTRDNATPWYRVDSAGTVFTATSRRQATTVFRLAATLYRPIHVDRLQQALDEVLPRFPMFAVHLRRGVFWTYLQHNERRPRVLPDSRFPCLDFPVRGRGVFPFRVLAFHRRLAVEFTHAVTDGYGALQFLRSLLVHYLTRREGLAWDGDGDVLRPDQSPVPEEAEDAFRQHYRQRARPSGSHNRAFRIPDPAEPSRVYHVTTAQMSTQAALELARRHGVSLTEFFAAVLLDALQEVAAAQPGSPRPLRLEIPVNLRSVFPTRSLLNFFTTVRCDIDPNLGHYDFDEILRRVHHQMRLALTEKELSRAIARNVSARRHPLLRIIPFAVKDHVLPRIYRHWGLRQATCSLSNLGAVRLPPPCHEHVERVEFVPAYPNCRKIACGIISLDDRLCVTFGRTCRAATIERNFVRRLTGHGLAIRIETNDPGPPPGPPESTR